MEARDIMAKDPKCCAPEDSVSTAAKLMAENDCGQIPVVDQGGVLVGVITDRDIACRCVAAGKPSDTPVSEVMSKSAVTVTPDTSIDDCCRKMEDNQIRRLPVIDDSGKCCGMVSQADIAQRAEKDKTGDLVRQVSLPSETASSPGVS